MTRKQLDALTRFFDGYTLRFADAAGRLHPMQQLKVDHSRRVTETAGLIVDALAWPGPERAMGLAAALLHDIGRFSQFAEFGTFSDRDSINHAVRGAEILAGEGALDGLPAAMRETLLCSVRLHNVRAVPDGLPEAVAAQGHLVRDADKLDIFHIFEDAIRHDRLDNYPEIVLGVSRHGPVTPEVLTCLREGRVVDYALMHSLGDFVLVQVSWLRSAMHYDAALTLAAARRVLDFQESFVRGLDDSPAVRDCFAATRAAMAARLRAAR